jgi:hypothetical protein
MSKLDAKIPKGPLKDKWTNHKNSINLVNPRIDIYTKLKISWYRVHKYSF